MPERWMQSLKQNRWWGIKLKIELLFCNCKAPELLKTENLPAVFVGYEKKKLSLPTPSNAALYPKV